MILTRSVAPGVWLAVDAPETPVPRGAARGEADWAAARRAWGMALDAAGLTEGNAAGSRSHTAGSGAAVVGPVGTVLGVDLVVSGRITTRHAGEILDRHEWKALEGNDSRPALGWGLKEAAAKAFGVPGRRFPLGVGIARGRDRLEVFDREPPHGRLAGHWEELGTLLCVWVLGPTPLVYNAGCAVGLDTPLTQA